MIYPTEDPPIPLAHQADMEQAAFRFIEEQKMRMQLGDHRDVAAALETLLIEVYKSGRDHSTTVERLNALGDRMKERAIRVLRSFEHAVRDEATADGRAPIVDHHELTKKKIRLRDQVIEHMVKPLLIATPTRIGAETKGGV